MRAARRKLIEWFDLLKESRPCRDCGRWYPYYVMQHDHVSGDKDFSVGRMVRTMRVGFTRAQAEIAKCELVCANCHAVRSYFRQRGQPLPHLDDP